MPFMYILECSDRTYYTGSTWDVAARFAQHLRGDGSIHTRHRLPVRLVYYEEYDRIEDAYDREHQVQRLLRGQKRKLIATGWGVRPADPSRPFSWLVQ